MEMAKHCSYSFNKDDKKAMMKNKISEIKLPCIHARGKFKGERYKLQQENSPSLNLDLIWKILFFCLNVFLDFFKNKPLKI